jgi:hypothetical protein
MDGIKCGYDRNGNRTYRENAVATANGAKFDEKYLYDMIDRLKNMDRGQLTALHDAISDKTFGQCWSLDATGNWQKFLEDSNGDGNWDLDQTRTDKGRLRPPRRRPRRPCRSAPSSRWGTTR